MFRSAEDFTRGGVSSLVKFGVLWVYSDFHSWFRNVILSFLRQNTDMTRASPRKWLWSKTLTIRAPLIELPLPFWPVHYIYICYKTFVCVKISNTSKFYCNVVFMRCLWFISGAEAIGNWQFHIYTCVCESKSLLLSFSLSLSLCVFSADKELCVIQGQAESCYG